MSVDKVKFRQAVEPGDSIEIRVKLIKIRGNKIATASGECKVNGKVCSNAELMFSLRTQRSAFSQMATDIHPTAIIEPGAELDERPSLGPMPTSAPMSQSPAAQR